MDSADVCPHGTGYPVCLPSCAALEAAARGRARLARGVVHVDELGDASAARPPAGDRLAYVGEDRRPMERQGRPPAAHRDDLCLSCGPLCCCACLSCTRAGRCICPDCLCQRVKQHRDQRIPGPRGGAHGDPGSNWT